jgi:TPR repeat protein
MAQNKVKSKPKLPKGPLIAGGLLILILVLLGVRRYFSAQEQIAKLHKEIFKTTNSVSTFSFGITKLAIIVNTELTSDAIAALPALKYRITHEIGLASHEGEMELKLSDNTILAETMNADIKIQLLFEDDHIFLLNPALVYKTLDREVSLRNISGKIHYTGDAAMAFEKLDYKDPKFEVIMSQISITTSRKELKFNLKAQEMSLNGVGIENPSGSLKLGDKSTYIFKGTFNKNPVDFNFVSQNGMTYGKAKLPVGLIDAAFDATLELVFNLEEEKVSALNNPKDTLIFEITKGPKIAELKKNILATLTKGKNIKRDEKFYTITLDENEVLSEESEMKKLESDINALVKAWSEYEKEKMLDEAFYALFFGDNLRSLAAHELVRKFRPALKKEPLFHALLAASEIRAKAIDQHKYKDDTLGVIKEHLLMFEKEFPEHKYTMVIKLKEAEILGNKETISLYLKKLIIQETNPDLKLLFQAKEFEHSDPKKALALLEKINPTSPFMSQAGVLKAHLYGHLNDLSKQELALKDSYLQKKSTLLDLADYGEVVMKQNKTEEALLILDQCLLTANSKNRCHDIREEVIMKKAITSFKSKPEDAFINAQSLLFQRPAGRHAHYAMGWMYELKQNVLKSMEHFSIACALGHQGACLSAGDGFSSKLNDFRNAFYMYEIACDLNSSQGCTKAGQKAQHFNLRDKANVYLSKSCNDFNDPAGCYHYARNLQKMNKSKEDVAIYLDKACKEIKSACQFARVVKSGKTIVLPEFP